MTLPEWVAPVVLTFCLLCFVVLIVAVFAHVPLWLNLLLGSTAWFLGWLGERLSRL